MSIAATSPASNTSGDQSPRRRRSRTAATNSAVQVVSVTHKLTDGSGPASVLSPSICAKSDRLIKKRSRKGTGPAIVVMDTIRRERGHNSSGGGDIAAPATLYAQPSSRAPGINSGGLIKRANQTTQAAKRPAIARKKPKHAALGAKISGGQLGSDNHEFAAAGGNEGSNSIGETQAAADPLIAEIIQLWRMRQRWHRAEKSLVLQGKAVCRSWCGGDKDAAGKLFDAAVDGSGEPELMVALAPFLSAIEQFAPQRAALEKRLRKLAQSLPVYSWVKDVAGFGDLRLAAITGECGDIGSYRNPSCVWKRMGLAVIRDERQRRVSDPDLAIEMGYSPERRSVAYLLGQEIMRGEAVAGRPLYRPVYDQRREYEMPRCEAMAEEMKRRFGKYSAKAHAHNRAARYMTKRVLRDLWVAWRRTKHGSHPIAFASSEQHAP